MKITGLSVLKTNFGRPTFDTQPQSNVFVVRGLIYYVFKMEEEDKQYLLQAIFDVINYIDRFSIWNKRNTNPDNRISEGGRGVNF